MTMRHVVTSSGLRLAYDDSERADLPAVVLLHALGEDRSTWNTVRPRLEERFRVLAFDLRGHGDSDWPGTYGFHLMCDDILDAVDRLGLKRFSVVGHSMGAVVSYLAAIRQPNRLERLVVEDAPPTVRAGSPRPGA